MTREPKTLEWHAIQGRAKAEPMRRYVAFAYTQYYPGGGEGDWIGSFDSVAEAREYAGQHYSNHDLDVLDREAGVWVRAGASRRPVGSDQ